LKTVLAIIPARAGSKRLPGKNLRPLCGKPLIAWTIEAARQSRLITDLVCSTDDERVMELCIEADVDVIVRPAELATDTATSESVIAHALMGYEADYVCLLQPTSPLRIAEDIDACVAAAMRARAALTESMSNPGAPNGAVYAAQVEHFRLRGGFSGAIGVVMPSRRSVDIDTIEDFERAEGLMMAQREAA
jgi:CMP-N,N'-diacetyllegionaminic acid synthase